MRLRERSDTGWLRRTHGLRRIVVLSVALTLLLILSPFAPGADGPAVTNPDATAGMLITAGDGHRYGVTADGGPAGSGGPPAIASGTVFRIAADDTVTVLHAFSINDPAMGWGPRAPLVEGPDGMLYGTTAFGGEHCATCGTIFRITPTGVHTRLHSFDGNDGAAPASPLTVGADGRLYGVTDGDTTGIATLFAITTDGQFELLRRETAASGLATTQSLAVEMLATVQTFDPNVFPGPDTALLDDFNRPNSNDLGLGWPVLPPNYSSTIIQIGGIQGSAHILTRAGIETPFVTGRVQGGFEVNGGNYWDTPFDADQEVYGFFFSAQYNTFGLLVRYDPQTGNGYAFDYNEGITLYRVINNEFQLPPLAEAVNAPRFTGDNSLINPFLWIGLRAAGNIISVWTSKDRVEWTRILAVTDNQVSGGGHVGFHLHHEFQYFDNIHAGNLDIPPPPPPPPPPPDDDDDGGDDGGNGGNNPGNGGGVTDPNVNPISGSPGGGRRGGIGLGATGPETLLLLGFLTLAVRIRTSLC